MVEPPALAFAAGQWVSVPFGPKIVRAYSISSTPSSPARITLCADVAPGGLGSRWFRGLRPGGDVAFKGPLGGFVFSRDDPRAPLFVAQEIGIVPIRGILRDLADTGFGRSTTLVYWGRSPDWLAYDDELRLLARHPPGFAYHPVVEAAPAGWPGLSGDVVPLVERVAAAMSDLVAYVAGGAATIDRVRAALLARGLVRKAVKWEKFW
jgi:ferredoxin-NADP reductase